MNLVKWLRKNKQKIMVWVVVVIMITFVGNFSFRQLLAARGPSKQPIATLDGKEIKALERMEAMKELEILRDMGAGQVLMSHRSLSGPLLAQLLFQDSSTASMLEAQIKYAISQGNFAIDDELIQSFFEANKGDSPVYWMLLHAEALKLGCVVDVDKAMETYRDVVLSMTQGRGQAATVVQNLSNQHKVPQSEIMEIFSKLLTVITYVDTVTRTQSATLPEIEAMAGFAAEKISAKYIDFRADSYIKDIETVEEAVLSEQFESYKNYFAGDITENNPYGFGYKLPERVMLEYAVVNLDDVEKLIAKPTTEDMETYYSRNRSNFTEEVPTDPSDPESETTTRTKNYSEVMGEIENTLTEQRTNARAEMIMNDFRNFIGKDLLEKDTEQMTGEQIKEFAGNYEAAAKEIGEKHGLTIFTGTTGYLSREQLRMDRNLGRLSEQKPGRMPLELITKVFAVQGLDAETLSRFDGQAPKIYENIGPMQAMYPNISALVRVVDYKAAEVPANIDVSYDITKSALAAEKTAETFSVRQKVTDDCKLKLAMDIAKQKAEQFIAEAKDDWQAAIDKYNEEADNKIRLTDIKDRNRISDVELASAKIQAGISSMGAGRLTYTIRNKMMLDGLYSLKSKQLPQVFEFAAGKSAMAVKEVNISSPTTADYEEAKKELAAQLEGMAAMKAAFIQLNADNILARSNFVYLEPEEDLEQE